MRMYYRVPALLIALIASQFSMAQDSTVSIHDFDFLRGYWSGTGFGGQSEEVWMPPVDGRMFGIFKQSDSGKLVFTEFLEILEQDEGFVLRLKHFNPDFSGWEEKDDYVTFRLTSVTGNKAVFGGLSYELLSPNELQVRLRMRADDGSTSVEVFDFVRGQL